MSAEVHDAVITIDLISRNRHEAAFERVRHSESSVAVWLRDPYGPLRMIDFVECCVRLGRPGDGRTYLDRVHRSRPDFWSTRHAALMTAAEAILAENCNDAMFELALGDIRKSGWSFDLPRVTLAYGEWLRRNHRILDSRRHLVQAVALFDGLGAVHWVRRAEEELRAAGSTQRDSATGFPFAELTGQEHRIASMAASGLTNKEIGRELYLSARTVSGHLYRVFPKLQITKRSALRDALVRYDEERAPRTTAMAG
jgi:DNA-binding CsgD family transcriptional regulator